VICCWLDDQSVIPGRDKDFSLYYYIQKGSVAQPVSFLLGTRVIPQGVKGPEHEAHHLSLVLRFRMC